MILGATAIAGVVGYLIQAVVPAVAVPETYVIFSVFWSALYLVVSAASGVQQEVTRASRLREPQDRPAWAALVTYSVLAAGFFGTATIALAPFWAPAALGEHWMGLTIAMAVGVAGYLLVAVLSGALYGLRAWGRVATMTVSDSLIRLGMVAGAALAGLGIVSLGWAIAIPFSVAFAFVFVLSVSDLRARLAIDVSVARMTRNSLTTVAASLAMGVLISGLPLALGISLSSATPAALASLVLVVTLTRAPLVVPILALQSYLVVLFRDAPQRAPRRASLWSAGLAGASLLLAGVGALVGPAILSLLYGDKYDLPAYAFALVVLSAGLTSIMCVTGPAALGIGRHRLYVSGWVTAAAGVVLGLAITSPSIDHTLVVLVIAPAVGACIHLIGLAQRAQIGPHAP